MTTLIQIAPGVVFAAQVLSPEWGREFRSGTHTPRSSHGDDACPASCDASDDLADKLSEQIALL